MAWFKKKPDLISDRARALSAEIAALEAQIQKLDSQVQRQAEQPRLRSTALPQGSTLSHPATGTAPEEPVFVEVEQKERLEGHAEPLTTPEHYNELGVRKYDLPALLRRLRHQFRGPATTNPKLVSYLAAGGIQGLRPLRYEKRIARNRFLAMVAVLLLTLLGLFAAFWRH